jgi:hypothetical protein
LPRALQPPWLISKALVGGKADKGSRSFLEWGEQTPGTAMVNPIAKCMPWITRCRVPVARCLRYTTAVMECKNCHRLISTAVAAETLKKMRNLCEGIGMADAAVEEVLRREGPICRGCNRNWGTGLDDLLPPVDVEPRFRRIFPAAVYRGTTGGPPPE